MSQISKEIEIHLPFETLVEILSQLSPEDLAEVRQRIDDRLRSSTGIPQPSIDEVEDTELWTSEIGQMILSEADDSIRMEDVLRATSRIKGSLAAEVIAERDER